MFMAKFECVILAAGNGTRLWPLTEKSPKCMIRVLKKPLVEWIVESVYDSCDKIVVVIGDKSEEVKSHLEKSKYASKLEFVLQAERKGTGHAILQAEQSISGDFFVLNADTFAREKFFKLLAENAALGKPFIVGKKSNDAGRFGVLELDSNGLLKNFVEKPQNIETGLINTGAYFLPKSFFECLKKLKISPRGELEATDAILDFAKHNELRGLTFDGYWNDIGYYWNYLEASDFALKNQMVQKVEGKLEENVYLKGKLSLGKGSIVKSGTRIEGNVFIGENCTIGPNAFLIDCVIEDNCVVGNSTELKRSVLMTHSNLPHLNYVGDSAICEDCNFGAGSKVANFRFDGKEIDVLIKDKKINSRRIKLGAAVGKGTKVGINSSINCGTLIGSECRILPCLFVKKNLESGTFLK